MTVEEYRKLSKKTKYHAKKTEVDGIMFDSKKEAMKYIDLKILERAGKIKHLCLQVPYTLIDKSQYGRKIVYKADFVYYDVENRRTVVLDTKGFKTPVYRLKKRLLAERYGVVIVEE